MSKRREFLRLLAAGPAAGILVAELAEVRRNVFAADVETAADLLGRIPENIIYTKMRPGVWKGKDGSHVPTVTAKKSGGVLTLTVENKHGMSELHYIVRHTVVSEKGEVLGAKTFSWKDQPVSTYEIAEAALGKAGRVFATSYCNLHDLWVTLAQLDV